MQPGNPYPTPAPVYGHAAVASSTPLASAAGAEVLLAGGNAADAAVAVGAALAVTEPCANGLGGDLLALHFCAATRAVTSVLGNGRSPKGLDARAFPVGPVSPHAVVVPGAVAAWEDLSARFGRLPLTDALRPARRLARHGFPVAPRTAAAWAAGAPLLRAAGAVALLVGGGGAAAAAAARAPRPGELFRNPDLASVLDDIASGGARAGFYERRVAGAVAGAVQARGGALSTSDLRAHRTRFAGAASALYRGVRVHECGPPSHGPAALLMLNVAGCFDLAALPRGGERATHTLIECARLGFAEAAAYVADPDCAPDRTPALLRAGFARALAARVGARRAPVAQGGSLPPGGTVQFCVVDAAGDACSVVQSNYLGFGTGIVPEGCGFSLANRGLGFVTTPGHPNEVAPGKRPYHTIIPGLITDADGELVAAFGVMGSYMQPQGHMQIVSGIVDHGLDAQQAVDAMRFRVTGPFSALEGQGEDEVLFPHYADPRLLNALRDRGHVVRTVEDAEPFGRAQVILRDKNSGVVSAGSDSRADGNAIALPKLVK